MDTLKKRRDISKAVFVANLLTGKVNASHILEQININAVSRSLRSRPFLRLDQCRTEYGQNEPIRSMCLVFNRVFNLFDFNISVNSFKNRLRNVQM